MTTLRMVNKSSYVDVKKNNIHRHWGILQNKTRKNQRNDKMWNERAKRVGNGMLYDAHCHENLVSVRFTLAYLFSHLRRWQLSTNENSKKEIIFFWKDGKMFSILFHLLFRKRSHHNEHTQCFSLLTKKKSLLSLLSHNWKTSHRVQNTREPNGKENSRENSWTTRDDRQLRKRTKISKTIRSVSCNVRIQWCATPTLNL